MYVPCSSLEIETNLYLTLSEALSDKTTFSTLSAFARVQPADGAPKHPVAGWKYPVAWKHWRYQIRRMKS